MEPDGADMKNPNKRNLMKNEAPFSVTDGNSNQSEDKLYLFRDRKRLNCVVDYIFCDVYCSYSRGFRSGKKRQCSHVLFCKRLL